MRFIGDIHGDLGLYQDAIEGCSSSIQLGDYGMGFIDPAEWPTDRQHRFIRGNHDNPDLAYADPRHIPSGPVEADPEMFVIGGGHSIDKDLRTVGLDWWPHEEHTYMQLSRLISTYKESRPKIMVTHEAPHEVTNTLFPEKVSFGPSMTAQALNQCLMLHSPAIWFFGHWHKTRSTELYGCKFICLDEGDWYDLDRASL